MIRLSENVRKMTSPDGGSLLDVRRGKMFRLNATASAVVELLARGWEENRIALEISVRYGLELAPASAEVHEFLASLRNHGLLDSGSEG